MSLANAARSSLEFDLQGDNSGTAIRFERYSQALQAFQYVDLALNFNGWRHFAFRLDGADRLQVWNATRQQVASSMTIWQVSGSWNNKPGTFYLDNVRLVTDQIQFTQPQLTITSAGPQLRLSWPAEFADFGLQATATLAGPWQPVTTPVLNTNCECSVPVTPDTAWKYFRLARP